MAWVPFCTQARASSPVPSATAGEKAHSTRGFERVRELVGVACSQVAPLSADVSTQPVQLPVPLRVMLACEVAVLPRVPLLFRDAEHIRLPEPEFALTSWGLWS